MNHSKPEWTPIFNDAPPLNSVSQEASPGSAQGGSSLIQGQDPDSAAAAAAANFLGLLEVLCPLSSAHGVKLSMSRLQFKS